MIKSTIVSPLTWGYHYLMVEPTFYQINYSINPYMDPTVPVAHDLAQEQWINLKNALENAGAQVKVMGGSIDHPDMVYAMNLAYVREDGEALLSNMAYSQRAGERPFTEGALTHLNYRLHTVGEYGWEAGDVFPLHDDYIAVGVGPRTSLQAAKVIAAWAQRKLIVLPATRPEAYHLDLSFMPLADGRGLVHPRAWANEGWDELKNHLSSYLILTEEETFVQFAANSIIIGSHILLPLGVSLRVKNWLETEGFTWEEVDVSEFHKGGGSLRCMVNSLDFPGVK